MKCKVIGIDLAKTTMQVCLLDDQGQVVSNKKVSRKKLVSTVMKLDTDAPVAMEACATSFHWARRFEALGRQVKLIPAQHVKPLVGHQKNDANDALAICEAASRPRIHFVPIKTGEQQNIQSVKRIRQRHVDNRTAVGNQIRGLCAEYGVYFKASVRHLREDLTVALAECDNELSTLMREEFHFLYEDLLAHDNKVKSLDKKLHSLLRDNDDYIRLREVPGIGPLTASALISDVGKGAQFQNGSSLSAWCGLIPRQNSSGGKDQLLGITKNGNRELGTLLIHGARAVIYRYKNKDNALGKWLSSLIHRRGVHKAIVALANKLGRIVWAIVRHQSHFDMSRAFS